jgi:antitoxin (DNA-binding transcriptional repressor) of toxin-antitoxin stability system
MMRRIQASEAKAHLAQLLDEVERGETLVITRHGRAIAQLGPEQSGEGDQIDQAIARIRRRRPAAGGASLAEILAARDEGRRG